MSITNLFSRPARTAGPAYAPATMVAATAAASRRSYFIAIGSLLLAGYSFVTYRADVNRPETVTAAIIDTNTTRIAVIDTKQVDPTARQILTEAFLKDAFYRIRVVGIDSFTLKNDIAYAQNFFAGEAEKIIASYLDRNPLQEMLNRGDRREVDRMGLTAEPDAADPTGKTWIISWHETKYPGGVRGFAKPTPRWVRAKVEWWPKAQLGTKIQVNRLGIVITSVQNFPED